MKEVINGKRRFVHPDDPWPKEAVPEGLTEEDPFLPGFEDALKALAAHEQGMDPKQRDNVVLPEHYARFKIEPVRFIGENKLNFFQGNIIKYVLRYDAKNGLEDIRKAERYCQMFRKYLEGDEDWWKEPKA